LKDPGQPALTIRTAVAADLPALRQVFRTASLSNAGDAPMYATDFYRTVGFVEADRVATELGTGLRMYLDLTPTGRRDRHGRESGGG
jgi:hypothetical protein